MKQQELVQPYFVRFLESQKVQEQTAQGANNVWPPIPPIVTKPILDLEQTQKYPSDGDEI
jgi:hypothetical protein